MMLWAENVVWAENEVSEIVIIIIIFIHQNTNTGTYEITYNNRYKAYLYNSYKI